MGGGFKKIESDARLDSSAIKREVGGGGVGAFHFKLRDCQERRGLFSLFSRKAAVNQEEQPMRSY